MYELEEDCRRFDADFFKIDKPQRTKLKKSTTGCREEILAAYVWMQKEVEGT